MSRQSSAASLLYATALVIASAAHAAGASPEQALPLGRAAASDVPCPADSPSDTSCLRLQVGCPSIADADAILRVTRPRTSVGNRGTIVLTSGGEGTVFPGTESRLGPSMIAAFAAVGLVVVEVAWEPPGIWGGPRARTLACRYATVAKWIYDHVHQGGKASLFAAQGTSGGASQIAFALAHYGMSEFVDLANLGGGPPGCPRCAPDGQHAPEPLLPGPRPAANREPAVDYPATAIRFFLGDREPSADIVRDADLYYNAIISEKSFVVVHDTPHVVEQTPAGVDALIAAVRAALK